MIATEILKKYENFLSLERRLKPQSIKEYLYYFKELQEAIPDPLAVKHRSEIVKVIADLKSSRQWEDMTTWRCSFLIKKFYDWLTLEGIIPYNPYPFNAFRKPRPKEPKFLLQHEFDLVMQNDLHLTHQDKTLLSLFWDTGIRDAEMSELDQFQLDQKERILHIPAEKSKGGYGARYAAYTEKSAELLDKQLHVLKRLDVKPHVFIQDSYKRLQPDDITKRFIRIGKLVLPGEGYVKITPHMLRHSLGIRLKEAGASDLDVMTTLGHNSLQMTKAYTHSTRNYALAVREKYLQTA